MVCFTVPSLLNLGIPFLVFPPPNANRRVTKTTDTQIYTGSRETKKCSWPSNVRALVYSCSAKHYMNWFLPSSNKPRSLSSPKTHELPYGSAQFSAEDAYHTGGFTAEVPLGCATSPSKRGVWHTAYAKTLRCLLFYRASREQAANRVLSYSLQ